MENLNDWERVYLSGYMSDGFVSNKYMEVYRRDQESRQGSMACTIYHNVLLPELAKVGRGFSQFRVKMHADVCMSSAAPFIIGTHLI